MHNNELKSILENHLQSTHFFMKKSWDILLIKDISSENASVLKFTFSEKATKIGSYHPLDLTFTK